MISNSSMPSSAEWVGRRFPWPVRWTLSISPFFFNDTATTEIYTLSHTTLFRSEVSGHVRLVARHEIIENFRARGGAHAFGREHVLDAERDPLQRPPLALGEALVGFRRHRPRLLRRWQHVGVQALGFLHRG